MKIINKSTLLLLTVMVFVSCAGIIGNQPVNSEDFKAIETDLKREFGDDAYYTDLTIMYNESIGNMIGVTVTEAPESLTMGQWNYSQGFWKQNTEISLEVPQGTKAADFMFQLNDKINLANLGELVEKSMNQLTAEKDIDNPRLEMAFVNFPKNGDMAKAEYHVKLQPEHGGTSFSFYYALNGELLKMNY